MKKNIVIKLLACVGGLGIFGLLNPANGWSAVSVVEVVSYTAGTGTTLNNTSAVLGIPNPQTGSGMFDGVFSPFNPHYNSDNIVQIGFGGSITLRLSHYITVTSGVREIGIWENVGLIDTSYPSGVAGNPATTFGSDSATVDVSDDGVNFVSLGVVTFNMFGNYWADAPDPFSKTDGTVVADFYSPYTGSLSDFDGMNYSQIKTQLAGTAGGTWLDLSSTGLAEVGWVRFSGVADGFTLELDAVTGNASLMGAATVPEPATLLLLGLGSLALLKIRRRS